jgi:hypothetical protein
MRASLAVALGEYNGRASQWRHFAALREDSATLRDNEPYSTNRKSASLQESRRFTQVQCPNLSENFLFAVNSLAPPVRETLIERKRPAPERR